MPHAFIASAPTRLDFGGGWTDVPPYPEERGGVVCNLAITRRATARVVPTPTAHDVPHHTDALVAAALRRAAFPADVTVVSDFPIGAGLGGSSAAGVALAAALHAARGLTASPATLAEWSREVEVADLGIAGGRQDHYAAAYGGALGLRFGASTHVEQIPLTAEMTAALEHQCLLAYTGESRISGDTIAAVLTGYRERVPRVVQALARMAALAEQMIAALRRGAIDELVALVDEHWQHQRALHPGITTTRIDALEQAVRAAGATAVKALGASGGGCVVVFAPADRTDAVAAALAPFAERLAWRVDPHGVQRHTDAAGAPAVRPASDALAAAPTGRVS
ncbi:MAG: hypothetical protein WCK74_13040 [Gemmatimonadaceae bacterium]